MSNPPRDNKGNIKCEVCGGYGYVFDDGASGQRRCPSCEGTTVSRNPRHKQQPAKPADLDLP
jgi:ssDNA-binding Zn-finger/Zn-ribbon topoisomerase 1